MFEYDVKFVIIKDPDDSDIITDMNRLGKLGWDVFSVTERVVENWTVYGKDHCRVEYKMYMKKRIGELV